MTGIDKGGSRKTTRTSGRRAPTASASTPSAEALNADGTQPELPEELLHANSSTLPEMGSGAVCPLAPSQPCHLPHLHSKPHSLLQLTKERIAEGCGRDRAARTPCHPEGSSLGFKRVAIHPKNKVKAPSTAHAPSCRMYMFNCRLELLPFFAAPVTTAESMRCKQRQS